MGSRFKFGAENCQRGSLGSGTGTDMSGLSEAEQAAFTMAKRVPGKSDSEVDKEQTVSKVRYNQDIEELKEKIKKKDEKIQKLQDTGNDLRAERDSYKKRLESSEADCITQKEKVTSLNKQVSDLLKEKEKLEEKVKELEKVPAAPSPTEISVTKENAELKKQILGLQNEIQRLKEDVSEKGESISKLGSNISDLEERVRNLSEDNENLRKASTSHVVEIPVLDSGVLKRISPTELSSDMFVDGRYDVKIARSGSSMLFVPNVEGSAVCAEHKIKLPRLSELIPFKSVCEYQLVSAGNDVLKAELR